MRLGAPLAIMLLALWGLPCKRGAVARALSGIGRIAVARAAEASRSLAQNPRLHRFSFDGIHWIDPAVAPAGYVRMTAGAQVTHEAGNALLLMDESRETVIPIFVGDAEALSIQLRLAGRHYPRPLTHDLLDGMLRELGGSIVSVQVDELRDTTFIGTVVIGRSDRRLVRLDARPSDAVALAVGSRAPIFVSEKVLRAAGRRVDELKQPAHPSERRPPPTPL